MARRRALLVAVLLLSYGAVGARQPAVRVSLPLPVDSTSLAASTGLLSSDPSTLLLHIVRLVHGSPDVAGADDSRRAALREALTSTDPRVTDLVPLPLDPSIWRESILERPVSDRDLVAAILSDRRYALLYHGLSALDDETLAWLGPDRDTLQFLRQHAGIFATWGRSIHVRAGRVTVPGGAEAEPAWEALTGVSPSKPGAFVQRIFRDDDGRMAFLYDAIAHLDTPRQRFSLGLQLPASSRDDRLRALLDTFTDPAWRPLDRPFSRPIFDASLMLSEVAVDARGRIRGPMGRRIWERVFSPGEHADLSFSGVETIDGPAGIDAPADVPVDAAWLAARITRVPPALGGRRLDTVLFAQRVFAGIEPPDPALGGVRDFEASLTTALRSYDAFPSLMMALERIGVTEPSIFVRAAQHAHALDAIKIDGARRSALTQFQSSIAIVERAQRAGSLSPATARALVTSLCEIDVSPDTAYEGRLGRWFGGDLLGALQFRPAEEASDPAEAAVLAAITGAGRSIGGDGATLRWNGIGYRVDHAGAALRRVRRVRRHQGGLSIDAALAAVIGETGPSPGGATDAGGHPPTGAAAERGLADTLSSVLYAGYLNVPDGTLRSGNVALRHDFGSGAASGSTAWRAPAEELGTTGGWRLRGSLLGLDAALMRLGSRRLDSAGAPPAPKLSTSDREVVALHVELRESTAFSDDARDEIAAALSRGRARASALTGDPTQLDKVARDAGLSEWRRQAVAWTLEHDRRRGAEQFSLLELFWLGAPRAAAVESIDAWGSAPPPFERCQSPEMPRSRPREGTVGRRTTGVLASCAADLALQIADIFASLGLPGSLVPGVLAHAMRNVADQSPPSSLAEWDEFGRGMMGTARDRVAEYVAALTVDGPLVPASEVAGRMTRR